MKKKKTSENGMNTSETEWTANQKPNTFAQFLLDGGMELPMEVGMVKELMAIYPNWAAEIAEKGGVYYEEEEDLNE